MTAGAEKVLWHPEFTEIMIDYAGVREGDVLLLLNPALLTLSQYRRIKEACRDDILFQVVGFDPVPLATDADIRQFRKIKAEVNGGTIKETGPKGRPKGIRYTVEQADAIIRLWHDVPRRKPSDIVLLADVILGLEEGTVKHHWVRDLVRKYVGTAQREKPKGWRGVRID